jgi:hypothetical protein
VTEQEQNNFLSTWGVNLVHLPEQITTIEDGIDFILEHFEEPLFPRNIATAATRGAQRMVDGKDRVILYCRGALRRDCRISCYPNYQAIAESNPKTPPMYRPKVAHLFIDLDLNQFGDIHKLNHACRQTLKNIGYNFNNGAVPSILWSGGGYHIHLPLDTSAMPVFEDLSEFRHYTDPSVKFMRYAERALTDGKADHNHCASFKSCLARIPGSVNSKYDGSGDVANVMILQRWNKVRARPTQKFLMVDFLIWLVESDLKVREELRKQTEKYNFKGNDRSVAATSNNIEWIERLLQTPIEDWRKTSIALILAPYLLTIKRMSYEQAFNTIMQWADKCSLASGLRPNTEKFIDIVHMCLARAHDRQSKPLRWLTLIQNYPEIHDMISKHSSNKNF